MLDSSIINAKDFWQATDEAVHDYEVPTSPEMNKDSISQTFEAYKETFQYHRKESRTSVTLH